MTIAESAYISVHDTSVWDAPWNQPDLYVVIADEGKTISLNPDELYGTKTEISVNAATADSLAFGQSMYLGCNEVLQLRDYDLHEDGVDDIIYTWNFSGLDVVDDHLLFCTPAGDTVILYCKLAP